MYMYIYTIYIPYLYHIPYQCISKYIPHIYRNTYTQHLSVACRKSGEYAKDPAVKTTVGQVRSRANVAHLRQSMPDYGRGFQAKGLKPF